VGGRAHGGDKDLKKFESGLRNNIVVSTNFASSITLQRREEL